MASILPIGAWGENGKRLSELGAPKSTNCTRALGKLERGLMQSADKSRFVNYQTQITEIESAGSPCEAMRNHVRAIRRGSPSDLRAFRRHKAFGRARVHCSSCCSRLTKLWTSVHTYKSIAYRGHAVSAVSGAAARAERKRPATVAIVFTEEQMRSRLYIGPVLYRLANRSGQRDKDGNQAERYEGPLNVSIRHVVYHQ